MPADLVKPVLAVASALACGLLLPLGTGAMFWGLLALGWVALSVPVSLFVGRMFNSRQHTALREQRNGRHGWQEWQE